MPSGFEEPLQAVFVLLLVAAVMAGVLVLATRRSWSSVAMLALAISPSLAIYLWSRSLRVFAAHGLLHTSIVYQIMTRGIPPDCPILAGETLYYPWGHHLLVAGLVELLGISPFSVFAALNLISLALTVTFMFKAGRLLTGDRLGGIFAAALSTFGLGPFNYPALFAPVEKLSGWEMFTLRNVVVANKFTTLQDNALGFVFFGLFLLSVLGIFSANQGAPRRRYYAGLAIAVLGAGFFYPIAWLALGASGGGVLAVVLWRRGREALPLVIRSALVMSGAALAVAPYLYAIAAGKTRQMFLIAPDLGFLFTKTCGWFWMTSLALGVALWKRRELHRIARERRDLLAIAAAPVAVTALMYVVIGTDWNQNEYKFFNLSVFSLGLFVSGAVAALYRENRLACFALLALCFLPFSADTTGKLLNGNFPVSDPFVLEGAWIRHADPSQEELYRWIESETDPEAVFLDTQLTIPAFARRRLYVGWDERKGQLAPGVKDGWQIPADTIMNEYFAYPPELVKRRENVAREVFDVDAPLPEQVVSDLREVGRAKGVYVVARRSELQHRLAAQPVFREVFENPAAAVYLLDGTRAAGS